MFGVLTPQKSANTYLQHTRTSSLWLNIYHHTADHFSNCWAPLKTSSKLASFKTSLEKRFYIKCRQWGFISKLILNYILIRLNFCFLMIQKILLCNDFLSSIMFILLTETLLTHMAFLYNLEKGPLFQDTFSPLVRNLS